MKQFIIQLCLRFVVLVCESKEKVLQLHPSLLVVRQCPHQTLFFSKCSAADLERERKLAPILPCNFISFFVQLYLILSQRRTGAAMFIPPLLWKLFFIYKKMETRSTRSIGRCRLFLFAISIFFFFSSRGGDGEDRQSRKRLGPRHSRCREYLPGSTSWQCRCIRRR